ncbi:hypothetical protein Vadar_017803 [Vaccinium darrowii]|uniref:Uncharacterized protein n=1 Tax=Vaccinium darrowii TaxID=229202 RepID=A0ACB7ZKJ6_9ERIC|nr:hypothetical protein Vadar_017803 [Vaccinium darrowii]
MLLHLGCVATLIISSANAAQEIMKTHDIIFSDRPESSIAKRLLYDCKDVSMAPYGEYWRQMKSIYELQLLSTKRVQSFSAVRVEETALIVKRIVESSSLDSPVNLSEMFISLTNDVICRTAFGRKYRDGETWVNGVNGVDARVERVTKVIEERLNGLEGKRDDGGEGKEDFLDILLRASKDNIAGVSIDRDSLKALILEKDEVKEELDRRPREGETLVPGGTGGKSHEAQEHLA